nr:MAG TPA: hypothetical protein [Caudoviricetes sp.]
MWTYYNPNPIAVRVGDCAVRAVAKAIGCGWEEAYLRLAVMGLQMGDMPSSNNVWGAVLRQHGFRRAAIDGGSAADFCRAHPEGTYVLTMDRHVAAVVDGQIYDTWDCTSEEPIYYWHKEE